MPKPQKPNLSFPAQFAATGQKTDFTQEKIENGFDTLQPDVLAGDNLNKFIDDVYQSITYSNEGVADLYKGVIVYDENEIYYKNSIVFNTDEVGTTSIFLSKVDNNIGNALTNETYWQEVKIGGGGLEIGDIGTALYIDETKGKRRWLNGSILAINENTQGFVNWLKKAVQSVPSLATTETNWQAEASLSVYGQCGKFVIDEEAGTIRLPKVVNIQGLQDLTKAGATVEAGLPSHTHTRGSMDITATFGYDGSVSGAIYQSGGGQPGPSGGTSGSDAIVTFKASRSWTGNTSEPIGSDVYGKSTTVQPEAIQYPYFIQIATGSETEVDIVNEIEFNNPNSLLDVKWSDKKINNLSWLISEGQSNSGAVYVDVYNLLVQEYGNSEDETETIGSTTITFRRGEETGIKITTDKTAYDEILATTGTAWYYVLDGENQAFYLPQTNGFLQVGEGGKFNKAGLPNITGELNNTMYATGYNTEGVFQTKNVGGKVNISSGSSNFAPWHVGFNASLVNSIYGNSDTVQPNSVNGYLYFYVGEAVQNANLIDAGRISEQLPNKLDSSIFNSFINSSDYIIASDIVGKNGWMKFKSGKLIQWGESAGSKEGIFFRIPLYVPYKDNNFIKVCIPSLQLTDTGFYVTRLLSSGENNSFAYLMYLNGTLTSNQPTVNWITIG